jgi:CheY-like chemotaxis protein
MKTLLETNERNTMTAPGREDSEGFSGFQVAWDKLLSQAEEGHPPAKRVVIIDDEVKARVLFGRALEKAGYETITFSDNAPAIQYLRDSAHPIDLLILDLNMPNIDGRYFREMLKIQHPSAKILIASNYAIDLQKYFILDADGYYDKTEGIKALKEKIKKVLTNQ